ncbi:MAG: glycosyltransferase involved in cell wall biosynthesis [Cryomorphaceae bacterium]|jgi:glycosyltransferase involved in cell wall biosynthesis
MGKMKKKLAIVGTVGLPACYGGFETLAEHLVEHTADDYDITVYCSGKKYAKSERKATYKGAKLTYLPFNANGIQSIIYDTISILHALFKSDVLLVLGVAGAWLFPFIRLFTSARIIVSIDGIEWKRDKWNKLAKWYLWWAEGLAVKYSHIDISDNESIQDYTAQRYGSLSQIIEYGADHTLKVKPSSADKKKYAFLKKSYAFKVCRIEPENNVHIILEAFADMQRYTLVIVGNWDSSEYGKALKEKYSDLRNLVLLDPIYNQRKLDVLRSNAMVYVHGHSAGGTNPSLVEAMYLGLPVIAFGVSYNRTTTGHRALYFNTKNDLIRLIENTSVRTLSDLSVVMKTVSEQRYTWQTIAKKYDYLVKKAIRTSKKEMVKAQLSKTANSELINHQVAHLRNQKLFFEN